MSFCCWPVRQGRMRSRSISTNHHARPTRPRLQTSLSSEAKRGWVSDNTASTCPFWTVPVWVWGGCKGERGGEGCILLEGASTYWKDKPGNCEQTNKQEDDDPRQTANHVAKSPVMRCDEQQEARRGALGEKKRHRVSGSDDAAQMATCPAFHHNSHTAHGRPGGGGETGSSSKRG